MNIKQVNLITRNVVKEVGTCVIKIGGTTRKVWRGNLAIIMDIAIIRDVRHIHQGNKIIFLHEGSKAIRVLLSEIKEGVSWNYDCVEVSIAFFVSVVKVSSMAQKNRERTDAPVAEIQEF